MALAAAIAAAAAAAYCCWIVVYICGPTVHAPGSWDEPLFSVLPDGECAKLSVDGDAEEEDCV